MPASARPLALRIGALLIAAAPLALATWTGAARAERTAGGYHVMLTPEYARATGRIAPQPSAGLMLYYGGTVFASVKVVSVMWGPNVNPTTVAGIPGFSAAIVDSTFMDGMAQYDTHRKAVGGRGGTQQFIGRGSYLGQYVITPQNTSTALADLDVQTELQHQARAGHIPPRDPTTLYMVYFPASVSIELDGMVSCSAFLAYHFATITYAASHELAEAVTDNIPTPGTNPLFPQSWNTSGGYEIADLCGGGGLLAKGASSWTVTQYYLNSTGRCSTGNYTSP